ncbi:MAG: hypothetical protein LW698_10460 [Planctomycetaceae bacterium]|nr:hypothetical protein [Planctomycetaceae bacterium]
MPPLDVRLVLGSALLGLTLLAGVPVSLRGQQPPAAEPVAADAALDDRFRKARLLGSDRWRRAVREFDAWLEVQPVYTPAQARALRADLDRRMAAMTSYEVEYLLDALDAKLRILDSPAARDAREWLARYLAVMADHRREEVLAELPNILDMTTADLVAGLDRLQAKRAAVEQQHRVTTQSRKEFATFILQQRRIDEAARGRIRVGDAAFSPYRPRPATDPPFADVGDGEPYGPILPWGPFVRVQVGGF